MMARRRSVAFAVMTAAFLVAGCGGSSTPAQTPPASGDPVGPTVALGAQDIAFDTAELHVAANEPFTIVFDNREAVPHNVSIDRSDGVAARVFEGAVFSGPATRWYAVPGLAAGAYAFLCQVHPSMTGRLIAA